MRALGIASSSGGTGGAPAVTITGTTAVGSVLTASITAGYGGTLTYQWVRGADGASDLTGASNISGATSSTYTLVSGDIGRVIGCLVSGLTYQGRTSGVIAGIAPSVTTAPAIVGTPEVGAAASYTTGTYSGTTPITKAVQWLLDGAVIVGETGATYTPIEADEGKSLAIRETASNAWGSAASTSSGALIAATGAGGVPALYAASPESWVPWTQTVFGSSDRLMSFNTHTIGSGDRKNLVFLFNAVATNTDTASYTILEARLVNIERTFSVPITFGGAATKTVNSGELDVKSDPILPSAFSIPSFQQGSKWSLKCLIAFESGATINTSNDRNASAAAVSQQWHFNSANTSPANSGNSDLWDWTGDTPNVNNGTGFSPMLLGEFVGPVAPVWYGISDSIGTGQESDSASGSSRGGSFGRALFGNGSSTQLAGIESGLSGATLSDWLAAPKSQYYAKYCTHAYIQMLTNDFGASGEAITLAQAQSRDSSAVSILNGYGISSQKIVRQHLLARVTSTDGYVTEANQTITGLGWGAGGNIQNFNSWTTSQIGTLYGAVYDAAVARGIDPIKWAVNGSVNYATADGLHPSPAMYAAMESPTRSVFDSLA